MNFHKKNGKFENFVDLFFELLCKRAIKRHFDLSIRALTPHFWRARKL